MSMSADSVDAGPYGDSGVQNGHTSGGCASSRWKDIVDTDVADEFGSKETLSAAQRTWERMSTGTGLVSLRPPFLPWTLRRS
jgi:hypothetical protein